MGLRALQSCASRSTFIWPIKGCPTGIIAHPLLQYPDIPGAKGNSESCSFHTSSLLCWDRPKGPQSWPKNNKLKFPPTPLGEEQRPAFVCHMKTNIKYSPSKMWYVACLVRGLRIDDAINQLKFVHKKGSVAARETLEEAQKIAVRDHNVEFPSNLWVSESFVGKGMVIKGFRRHARRRMGVVEYKYCHYFVTLEEGEPPEHYYHFRRNLTPQEMLQEWLEEQRMRTINLSL
ncbi:large ribosomal subunit protein uL22m isoform X2 [Panulirus ornatus]|uniref:large ribosomal subunit protein uL22m isoform X2 n=1 Tax=Panulirus ornatus TaxID=150431 RepID=UPI003A87D8A2